MAAITSSLAPDDRKIVGEALQGALVDLIDLSLLAKQAHWNLIGHHFRSLHLQLDEIVALARTHMDEMAERAVALGVNPDGRASTIANSSHVPQLESGWLQDGKVVVVLTDILESIIKRMRERVNATEKPDPVTQDLLIKATQDLEKQHWMVQAQR
ncbi:DNA starvation/stationary phase protection protein [Microtetraspora sp. NBRC 13810]|uniref:Dps family protein n=1 Tax=Microtetraspora sp. NBRC 13810 TaxID=3030990 RepID=UPI0024A180BB|nr:DNA starvation/stationary phase protection protein [Microtetraspora sp. NBRC 13810]GLW12075.1 DNA starvation/stationary phase protection protein [Microtetraspora sp. NBRC 13810]